jgi:hypothetical protein
MATIPFSSSFLSFFLFIISTLLFLSSSSSNKLGFAFAGREKIESNHLHHTHTLQVSSLLPSTTCGPSSKGFSQNFSLSLSLSLCVREKSNPLLISLDFLHLNNSYRILICCLASYYYRYC